MPGNAAELKDRVMALSKDERMSLLADIWDSLHADPAPTLSDVEEKLLESHLAEHRTTPQDTIQADVAHTKLRNRA